MFDLSRIFHGSRCNGGKEKKKRRRRRIILPQGRGRRRRNQREDTKERSCAIKESYYTREKEDDVEVAGRSR